MPKQVTSFHVLQRLSPSSMRPQRLHGINIKSPGFMRHDTNGTLVARKVLVIIGSLGETYVLVELGVGNTFYAAGSVASAPAPASPSPRSTNVGD